MSKKLDDFRPSTNLVDTTEVKAPRFVGLSILLHAAGLTALVMISATSFENPAREEIVIELTDAGGSEEIPLEPLSTPMNPLSTQALLPPPPPAPPSAPATPVPPNMEMKPKAVAKASAPVIPPPPPQAATSTSAAVTPEASLEKPISTVVPTMAESKVAEKLQEIEAQALADFESELQTDEDLSAADLALKAVEEKNAADAAAIQSRLAAVRAEAEKLAQASAAKGQGTGSGEGQGAGQVRGIESLRQMPGNPIPSYSEQERLQKQQGEVVFLAYIDRSGRPVQFKQTKTSGHSSLDQKTLAALKDWKFSPGQEGWVEIPFRWDIRGGPQELPALKRSKVSNRVD